MKRVELINISGKAFKAEEDAFEKLISYSKDIHSHFTGEEGKEIISDIETRLAELFSEILNNYGRDVLYITDVELVLNRVGNISDFEYESETKSNTSEDNFDANTQQESTKEASTESNSFLQKRLLRDPRTKMIGGVCSGLSGYLGIDVTILRILWLVSFIGVVPYLIMCIVVPSAKSKEDFDSLDSSRVWGKNKFYRDTSNKVLGGVCSGIANGLNIDPVWVRLIAVFMALFGGAFILGRVNFWFPVVWSTVVLYIVLWILLPKKITIEKEKSRLENNNYRK